MIKTTKIYARFASEVYDDFGESYSEQEYYRKEHADEEIRATKYALWMARAERAKATYENFESYVNYLITVESLKDDSWDGSKIDSRHWLYSWVRAELKCREYAEKFK